MKIYIVLVVYFILAFVQPAFSKTTGAEATQIKNTPVVESVRIEEPLVFVETEVEKEEPLAPIQPEGVLPATEKPEGILPATEQKKENVEKGLLQEVPNNPVKEKSRSSDYIYVSDYINMRKIQFYLGLKGGAGAIGNIGTTATNKDYITVGISPRVGGIIGVGFQPVPNFGIRLGLNVEHIFTASTKQIALGDTLDADLVSIRSENFDRTSILGDIIFDFRQGMWSSFFLNLSAGYSWVTFEGQDDSGLTAGLGLGVRWYANKYLTFDWTLVDIKATFAKEIIGEFGTTIGLTFQY